MAGATLTWSVGTGMKVNGVAIDNTFAEAYRSAAADFSKSWMRTNSSSRERRRVLIAIC